MLFRQAAALTCLSYMILFAVLYCSYINSITNSIANVYTLHMKIARIVWYIECDVVWPNAMCD